LPASASLSEFEQALRANFSAAHHLARWLTRTQADAEDALQEAVLRAFRSYDRMRPASPRAWLLRIVRNCCYDLRKQQHDRDGDASLEEEALPPDAASPVLGIAAESPEARLLRMADARALEGALRDLAPEYREVFLLREIEGLAYKEIADVAGIPVGTVMSRLSRARSQLRALMVAREKESA
jgi:RNA polymerase sigma-70 factor, ECF subfamily